MYIHLLSGPWTKVLGTVDDQHLTNSRQHYNEINALSKIVVLFFSGKIRREETPMSDRNFKSYG